MKARLTPFRIVSLYAIVGGLWILFSDKALMAIVKDPEVITRIGIIKGWGFVIVTACLIYFLIRRYAYEREEIEKKIRESGQYNRALFENSAIGLALCRMDGSFVDVNETYANIIGRTVEETLKLTYWDITPEKYAEHEQKQLENLKTTGSYGPYEKEYIHKDGGLVPVKLHGRIIEQNGDKMIWSSVDDITERKRMEYALKDREAQIHLFVQYSPAAIAMFDREMKYIVASRRWLTDYNLGDIQITGRSHYDIFPDIPERWKEIHKRCLAGAVEMCEEDPFPRADGSIDWVRWEVHPWRHSDDRIGGVIIFSEVITERKQAEQELIKHREHLKQLVTEQTAGLEEARKALTNIVEDLNDKSVKLEEANIKLRELDRLKSMFIASMSHELRTPLNSIIGFSSILLNEWIGPMNPEQKENTGIILRAGRHLLALINDVIDISKIEAEKIEVMTEKFDLYDLASEAASAHIKDMQNKGLEFRLDSLPQAMNTDRRRLLQCIHNLMSNAVKFTEKGTVSVQTRVVNPPQRRRTFGSESAIKIGGPSAVNSEKGIVNSNGLFTRTHFKTYLTQS